MTILSPATISKIQPGAIRREYADKVLPGLYHIMQPSGFRSWAVRTRINGRPVKLTLKDVKPTDLVMARQRAREVLEAAQSRPVPTIASPPLVPPAPVPAHRAEPGTLATQASTASCIDIVRDVWLDYVRLHLVPNAPASLKKYTSSMGHILPLWNDRPVASISPRDVIAVTDAALARGPEARNTTVVALSSFFNWCLTRDLVAASPVTVKKSKKTSRERFLTDSEVAVFWKGCTELGPVFGPLFQMLLLTGCRRSETAKMLWSEIDFAAGVWHLPGSRTKTKQPLDVALTTQMLAVLGTMPRVEGCPFVFSTNGRTAAAGFSTAKLALDKLAPIEGYILHDLRRTFATGLAKLGVVGSTIERCLNHVTPGVVGIYNRYAYAPELAAAWKLWSDHVTTITKGRRDD